MTVNRFLVFGVLGVLTTFCCFAHAGEVADPTVLRDIEYANVDGHQLLLDIYQPQGEDAAPVIVWIHGGAWRQCSSRSFTAVPMVAKPSTTRTNLN